MINIVTINAEIYNSTVFEVELPSASCTDLSIWHNNLITIIPGSGSFELYTIDLSLQQKTLKTIKISDNILWDGSGLSYATSSDGIIYYVEYPTNIIKKIDSNNNYSVSSTNIQDIFEKYCIALDEINSIIYITGGLNHTDESDPIMNRVLKCSLQTEECKQISSMNIARQAHVCEFWENKLYVFSGYTGHDDASIEVLDTTLDTNQWQLLGAELSMNRCRAKSIINPETSEVIIAGGYTNQGPNGDWYYHRVEVFNMKDNTMQNNYTVYLWEYTQSGSMTFDINNQIAYYIGGGLNIDSCYDTIKLITFPTSITTTTTSSPKNVTTSFLDNYLYLIVIGGFVFVIIFAFIIFFIHKKKKERYKMRLVKIVSTEIVSNKNIQIAHAHASYGSSSNIINSNDNMINTTNIDHEQSKSQSKSHTKTKSNSNSELFGDFSTKGATKGEMTNYGSVKPNDDNDEDEDMYDIPNTTEGASPQTPQ